jgi:cell fate regulator YaaT (PSP1 superfamily)
VTAARHFLVRYGRSGFVGRFAAAVPIERADRVVVRGPRGIEFGEVLVAHDETMAAVDGEVLRVATDRDDAEAARIEERSREVLDSAIASRAELPLAFIDIETTLDGTAILHAVAWGACDAAELLERLGARFNVPVRLLDLSRIAVAKEPSGCGKPDCGAGAGGCSTCGPNGCSTGSCSRGSVKSAEDLAAYFADLRRQMERAGLARTPLA